jgi:hypothetical protein
MFKVFLCYSSCYVVQDKEKKNSPCPHDVTTNKENKYTYYKEIYCESGGEGYKKNKVE